MSESTSRLGRPSISTITIAGTRPTIAGSSRKGHLAGLASATAIAGLLAGVITFAAARADADPATCSTQSMTQTVAAAGVCAPAGTPLSALK